MSDRTRTVAELRPRPALALEPHLTVLQAAKKMQAASSDSALVVSADGQLKGILTDTDVARKVVAIGLPADTTPISQVMTASPQCVRATANAVDALCMMVEKRFRHLPVLDANGAVVGVLDIAKCLYDAISRLERHLSSASSALSSAVLAAMPNGHRGGGSAQQLVDGMVAKMFSPTLGDLLGAQDEKRAAAGEQYAAPSLMPTDSVQAAAALMSLRKSAVLVAPSAREAVLGIASPKDLLFRLVAQGLDYSTPIEDVMTRAPDTMNGSASVLQALHQLQYGGYRNVPVIGESSEALGVLDVLTLMEGALLNSKTGKEGGLKDGARDMAENLFGGLTSQPPSQPPSRPASQHGAAPYAPQVQVQPPPQPPQPPPPSQAFPPPPRPPSVHDSTTASNTSAAASFLFKVCDPASEHMHRIHSHPRQLGVLEAAVRAKLSLASDAKITLRYDDDEGDRVAIATNDELAEAVGIAVRAGKERIVLYPSVVDAPLLDITDKENAASGASVNVASQSGSLAGKAVGIAGKAAAGNNLSKDEKVFGAGAILAALVMGTAALARR